MKSKLADMLAARNLRAVNLADALGVMPSTITAWVRGRPDGRGGRVAVAPAGYLLDAACAFFECEIGDLLEREVVETPTGRTWRDYDPVGAVRAVTAWDSGIEERPAGPCHVEILRVLLDAVDAGEVEPAAKTHAVGPAFALRDLAAAIDRRMNNQMSGRHLSQILYATGLPSPRAAISMTKDGRRGTVRLVALPLADLAAWAAR